MSEREMSRAELLEALTKALEMDRQYFRSFDQMDWLGLSGFSDEKLHELNQRWLAFEGEGSFESWLKEHDPEAHGQYTEQLETVWNGLKDATNIPDYPSIVNLRQARFILDY